MLRKFAAFDVLEASLAPEGGSALRAYAHRHSFSYDPRPGYLYVRSRAISSRTNDNFDTFPAEEIKKSYASFVGKPVFVNHNNDNHRRARGVIIDAALHEDTNPDGSPDTWSEVLMEVDAVRFPKLAKAILAGHIDRTSMGTDVAFSKCSFCGNKATTPLEYCQHIPKLKGKRIYRTTASGKKEGVLVSEICHGLKFFENSLLVEEPADPTAYFTGVDDHSGSKTASKSTTKGRCDICGVVRDLHRSVRNQSVCTSCHQQAEAEANKKTAGGGFPTEHEPQAIQTEHGWAPGCNICGQTGPAESDRTMAHLKSVLHTNQVAWDRGLDTGIQGTPEYDSGGSKKKPPKKDDNTPPYVLQADRPEFAHLRNVGRRTATGPKAGGGQSAPSDRKNDTCVTCGKAIYHVEGSAAGGWQHDVDGAAGMPHQALPKTALLSYAALLVESVSKGDQFFADNPVHSDHIVHRFLNATPAEHSAGMAWYSDAHHIAKAIGHGDTAKAAGVMGVYSAGTPVAPNYHYASRSIHHNTPVGGPNGVPENVESDFHGKPNASAAQAGQTRRILDGEHHSSVLKSPKVSNYAHLIEHGDDEPGATHRGRVVVDRHAVSAAIGRRITQKEFNGLNLSGHGTGKHGIDANKQYAHVANAYREATDRLRALGHDVKPHQVQAVSWTVQKRMNDQEDEEKVASNAPTKGNIQGRQNSQEPQRNAWEHHYETLHGNQHMPENPRMHWGSKMVYLAYGETKAPEDVDTLRDEECPVCGESDAYDGNRCDVCGFDAPPKMFQDPNLDIAKQLDLRKDIVADEGADPNNDGMPDVIPGSGQMGGDAIPMDPSAIPDPQDVGQQQVNQILDQQQPLDPSQLDENGQPVVPQNPLDQALPQDPNAQPMNPEDIAGQSPLDTSGQPEPGTPGDEVADLVCPVCNYQEAAAPPQSTDMDSSTDAVSGAAGALCPNCQQGQLMSTKDANAQMQQNGQPPIPAARASRFDPFPIFTLAGRMDEESCDTHGRKGCAPCGYGDNDEPNGTRDEKPGPKCDTHGKSGCEACGY